MRKIEKAIIAAVKARVSKRIGNTATERVDLGMADGLVRMDVRLHGSKVAEVLVTAEGQAVGGCWTLAGYPTVTTRRRVNAIGRGLFGGAVVWQRKGGQRSDCGPVGSDEWVDYSHA